MIEMDQESEVQVVDEIIASEPPQNVSIEKEANKEKEIPAETVEISKEKIINHLKPQENKYWRFSFKNESNTNQLKSLIETIPNYNLTVEFSTPQNTPDIILKQGDSIVGKINLLLCDRRDANLPEKYYCKLYFYHFKNQQIYDAVKTAVVNYFENFKELAGVGGSIKKINKKHRTHKKKKIYRRKKTAKRN